MINKRCFLNFVNSLSENEIKTLNLFLEKYPIILLERYDNGLFYKIIELFFTSKFDLEDDLYEYDDCGIDVFEELQHFGFNIKSAYSISNAYDLFESISTKFEYCLDKFYDDGQLRHHLLRKKNNLSFMPKINFEFNLSEVLKEFKEDDEKNTEHIEQQADRNSFNELVSDAYDGDISAFWESTF